MFCARKSIPVQAVPVIVPLFSPIPYLAPSHPLRAVLFFDRCLLSSRRHIIHMFAIFFSSLLIDA